MNFEDFVDMDWLNSNTSTDEASPNSTTLSIKDEPMSSLAPSQECAELGTQVNSKIPEVALPSTDHIKQLIEIAKQHLALREQQQQQQQQQLQEEGVQPAFDTSLLHLQLFATPEAAGAAPAVQLPDTSDGIDIKKLTPKERRQLRNKISARNFRVRRKEYINTLEAQVNDHKRHAERLKLRLDDVEAENKQLRLEVDALRRQNQLLQQQKTDISIHGSKASDTYRQDTRILVS
ncbi:hypothetical protein BX666DRAFT_1816112, partial [Dichotomocladium elegans]